MVFLGTSKISGPRNIQRSSQGSPEAPSTVLDIFTTILGTSRTILGPPELSCGIGSQLSLCGFHILADICLTLHFFTADKEAKKEKFRK